MPDNRPEALNQPLRAGVLFVTQLAPLEGKTITVASGRRTRDEQVALRKSNCGPTDYDIWEKPSRECKPPTAIPGTSRHETGDAVDLSGDKDWAFRKLQRHGFTRPVAGEDWHFEHPLSRQPPTSASDTRILDTIMDMARELADATGQDIETAARSLAPTSSSSISVPGIPVTLPSPGKSADFIADGVGGIIGGITDPLEALGALVGVLLDPDFWKRLGLGLVGVALIVVGLAMISRDTIGGLLPNISVSPQG